MTMLRLAGVAVLLLSAGTQGSHAAGRTTSIRGTTIAYRPAERAMQVVSHVLNRESLLFRIDGPKLVVVKLVYEHFGYTTLDSKTLEATPILEVHGRRDSTCNETFAAFVQNSPTLRNESSPSDATEPLVFLRTKPSGSQSLKCYRVVECGFRVDKSAAH